MKTPNDDYDNPWKMAAERYFREFLAIFHPVLEAAIDWSEEPTFHDQELRQVTRDATTGLRRLDKLVKVRLLDGDDFYIHLEVQLCRERWFGRRMFTYNSRLFDRYGCAVASIAVLADRNPGWRPRGFWCEVWGTRLGAEFFAVKPLDFLLPPVGHEGNFFALVTQAHFATMKTRHDPDRRLAEKIRLVRRIYHQGCPKQRILDFVDVLDWLMQLPESQKASFEAALSELERRLNMPYVNSMVRDAIARGEAIGVERGEQRGLQQGLQKGLQQGMQQGMQQGELLGERKLLMKVLKSRFGPLPGSAMTKIEEATESELSLWAERASVGDSLADVLDGR